MTDTVSEQAKNKKRIRFIVFNGIIAALYVVLTYFLAPISYGPVQARISEVMTVFPIFSRAMIPGVTLGCLISNLINPGNLEPVDIIGGTLATLIAGIFLYLTGKKNKWLGVIPPVIANGLIVGGYLPFLIVDPRQHGHGTDRIAYNALCCRRRGCGAYRSRSAAGNSIRKNRFKE